MSRYLFSTIGIMLLASSLLISSAALAAQSHPELAKKVGERAPIFQVVTAQGTLVDYDRDYYGKHHLVLTFIPAAFTPI
jgi:hypothetical protein